MLNQKQKNKGQTYAEKKTCRKIEMKSWFAKINACFSWLMFMASLIFTWSFEVAESKILWRKCSGIPLTEA